MKLNWLYSSKSDPEDKICKVVKELQRQKHQEEEEHTSDQLKKRLTSQKQSREGKKLGGENESLDGKRKYVKGEEEEDFTFNVRTLRQEHS